MRESERAENIAKTGWDSQEVRREFALDTAAEFARFALRCVPELLDLYVARRWQAYERWAI